MDEVLALPTDQSARIALRTQQVIAYETGAANTVDPLGGSYFVEALTATLEEKAESYFKRIDELGGVIPAIEKGFFQREIAEAAYRYQEDLEAHRRVMVGVTDFHAPDDQPMEILRIDHSHEEGQIERLDEVRRKRDRVRAANSIAKLKRAATGTDNLMPYLLDAVKAYATEGEIMNALIEVFGAYTEEAII
jgi:methylmalonyl-CoA mutase N-terminal domain/subunit